MNTRAKGAEYEARAAEFLESRGYEILERNFRGARGEIDLIARQENLADSIWWEFYFRAKEREGWPFLLCFHNVKIRRMKRHYFQAFFISHGFTEIGKGRPCSFLTKIDRDENNPFFQE